MRSTRGISQGHRSRYAVAVIAGLVLLVAGCGGDEAPSESVPTYESIFSDAATETPTEDAGTPQAASLPAACALVTPEEAELVAGTALDDAVADEQSCTFTGPPTGPLGQFEVYVGPGAKKFLDIDLSLEHEFTALTDVGEEAVIEDGAVFLRVGETWVALRVTRLDELSVYRDDLIALAETVAGRLS